MTGPDPDAWLRRSRDLLDASAQSLEAATLSRLNRARQAALATRHRPRFGRAFSGWAAVGASALAVALAFGLQRPPAVSPPPTDEATNRAAAADADDDLLAAEDLEFLEDLDFYQWLDREGLSPSTPEPDSRRPL